MRYLLLDWLDRRRSIQPPRVLQGAASPADPAAVHLVPATTAMTIVDCGPDYQTLPIRLPEEQHARLKTWSAEHGFSMATVIRGLVENFLSTHGRPAAGGGS